MVLKKIVKDTLKLLVILSVLFSFSPTYAKKKKSRRAKKVIKIREVVIKQRVIKPQAMFILSKSQQANIKSDIVTSQNFSERTIETMDEIK